jgi:hypothetical protein
MASAVLCCAVLCRRGHAAVAERDSEREFLCLTNYVRQYHTGSELSSPDQLLCLFGEVLKLRRQEEAAAAAAAAAAAQEQDAAAAASSSRGSSRSSSSSSSSSRNLPGIPQWLLPLLPPPRVGKLARQAAAPTHIDHFNALFIDGCTKAAANLALIQQLYQQPHAGYALGSLDPVELFGRAFNWAAYCYIYCYVQVLCWSHGESVAAAASVQQHAHDAAALYPHSGTLYCSSRSLTQQVPHMYGFMSAP